MGAEPAQERVGTLPLPELAKAYLAMCQGDFTTERVAEASSLGSAMLVRAGSVESAARALNRVRLQDQGQHLSFAEDGKLLGLTELHGKYLREMAVEGVPSRRETPLRREEAKNHGSVYGYEQELLQKAWKDAAFGATLLVDPMAPGVTEILQASEVAESPLGRVPKQNPDRTVSSEGRPINDMRRQNEQGSKFNHPPAPQPRHAAVARQSLWWAARHPGIPQRCAKRDVPRAFKWHFLRPRDVPEFAVRLAGILLISLVMPFGWVGAHQSDCRATAACLGCGAGG